jgi:hypothetical protein
LKNLKLTLNYYGNGSTIDEGFGGESQSGCAMCKFAHQLLLGLLKGKAEQSFQFFPCNAYWPSGPNGLSEDESVELVRGAVKKFRSKGGDGA